MRRFVKTIRGLALAAPLLALASEGEPAENAPPTIAMRLGETVALCKTGRILCPAVATCDDPSVAAGDTTTDGLVFRARAEGETLCSAASASGQGARRVFRIVVRK